MTTNGDIKKRSYTNYVAFVSAEDQTPRIGHLDLETREITALSYRSGTHLSSLYEVIEVGQEEILATDHKFQLSNVKLLPPISGRDVLAVGKNYVDHAKEFNASGYDSSDKVDLPTFPVIFTKRATSIVAHGDEIYPHPDFTDAVDYEGEIGVIVGKPGFRVSEADAMDHVWGYTIINDFTARERQRDHKQFYIGKSPDTFCPMGPIAVPKEELPKTLEIQTFVNGEKRQQATTEQLIFSVPNLIKTLSEAQTLQLGDVLATGTPAGVGFGFRPMKFLHPGDEVQVSVTGLGTLSNRIASPCSVDPPIAHAQSQTYVPRMNVKLPNGFKLTKVNDKDLFYRQLGRENPSAGHVLFIHGLGGSTEYFGPFASQWADTHRLHLFDLEGHGLSPTSARSVLSIGSFAEDAYALAKNANVPRATVVAHSMGCLVAVKLAIDHPQLVGKLVLMGPPPSPLPEAGSKATNDRAALVRRKGMSGVVDAVVSAGTSEQTKATNPITIAAARLSLTGQDPEGYAKACTALASAPGMDFSKVQCPTLILTGDEDKVSPPELCRKYQGLIAESAVEVLGNVGHWHLFEDPSKVIKLASQFLK